VSELAARYWTLRDGGTSHADAIDLLVTSSGIDRPSLRRTLERAHIYPDRPPPSRAAELAGRRPSAKARRSVDRKDAMRGRRIQRLKLTSETDREEGN
jgi:hypothetical protein